jgi:hypoxanthine phosphoribosyltransferase
VGSAIRVVHDAGEVARRIDALTERIAARHAREAPLLVVIAEGARRFAQALERGLRARGLEPDLVWVRVRRSARGTSLGPVVAEQLDSRALAGRAVLIVDDIADEGLTLQEVERQVARGGARSIERAVLVSKLARRKVPLALDYVGFELDDGWVVGFGMDLDGAYRELDYLAIVDGVASKLD